MPQGVPLATYRIQFNGGFRFADAEAIVPYLCRLGATHLYASPIFEARPGSTHGYDVTNHGALNPELGTEVDFTSLVQRLRSEGMSLLLDIVPNHMAADISNPWWADVLRHGQESRYASFFDIDWEGGEGRLVLPMLGHSVAEAVDEGHLGIVEEQGEYALAYFDKRWPVSPSTRGLAADAAKGDKQALLSLLDAQTYRLVHWRAEPPNYRRFFDIGDLVSVLAQEPHVFSATHTLSLDLLGKGVASGLRVDHVDGLHDPAAYLRQLREAAGGDAYLVVEKILGEGEALPPDWPVEGTSGYDFLAVVNGLFVDDAGLAAMGKAYAASTSVDHGFHEEVVAQKRRIMEMLFANETASLARRLVDILHNDLAIESVTEDAVASLLMDVTSELPVYRTYADSNGMTAHDKRLVERAADAVARRISQPDSSLLPGLRQALTLEYPAGLSSDRHAFWLHTVMRWQQLSGPATAKGLEDTSFYRFNRLISLNEVGGHAEGVELKDAHRFLHSRAERWPHAMSASSTHDTKRSEDARARIHALTWMADDWVDVVQQWMEWNRPLKRDVRGQIFPDANMEWMLYQTLAGVWPLRGEQAPDLHPRLQGFLTKAAREAKEHTSWLDVNGEYEDALLGFTAALLDPSRSGRFLDNLQRIVDRIAPLGAVLSLSQLAVKATAPGVPDFYQGQELWDFSMADPDNRRSVDYAARQSALDALAGANDADVEAIVAAWPDGRIKLYATQQLLALRRQHSDLFQAGRYVPLEVGPSLFAFARRDRDEWVLTVTPRSMRPAPSTPSKGGLPLGRSLGGGEVIRLPGGAPSRWRNVLTGQAHAARNGRLSAGALLQRFPVAVLTPA